MLHELTLTKRCTYSRFVSFSSAMIRFSFRSCFILFVRHFFQSISINQYLINIINLPSININILINYNNLEFSILLLARP